MIYCGYQGVGKSAYCKNKGYKCIDLDSSILLVNGVKVKNWVDVYVNLIEYFDNNDYDIFVSSHMDVRKELKKRKLEYTLIYPSIELKDDWERKIILRYTRNQTEKHRNAMIRTILHYDDDIKSLEMENCTKIIITNFKYNLEELIDGKKNKF